MGWTQAERGGRQKNKGRKRGSAARPGREAEYPRRLLKERRAAKGAVENKLAKKLGNWVQLGRDNRRGARNAHKNEGGG